MPKRIEDHQSGDASAEHAAGPVPSVPPVPADDRPPRRGSAAKGDGKPKSGGSAKKGGTDGTRGTGSPGSPPKPGRKPQLQAKLEELLASPALVYSFAGDEYAAHIIATRTPAMAQAWYELSQQNAGIRRMLERLTQGSAWGGVILSSAAVAVPLLSHHGVIPVPDPFAALYPAPPVTSDGRRPIVPPPPSPAGDPAQSEGPAPSGDGGRTGGDYTPPIGESPPGVVTIAGLQSIGAAAA